MVFCNVSLQWGLGFLVFLVSLVYYWYLRHLRRCKTYSTEKFPLSVTFLHPDLGLGGAERLVVDAALGLQCYGKHNVVIYTTHYARDRCFPETTLKDSNASLSLKEPKDDPLEKDSDNSTLESAIANNKVEVRVVGSLLPRNLFGIAHVFCATVRLMYASLYVGLFSPRADLIVVDQLSTPILLLKILTRFRTPILFYCHFPDKLCDPSKCSMGSTGVTNRGLLFKCLKCPYRLLFDKIEEYSLWWADLILFNSDFTRHATLKTFPSLRYKLEKQNKVLDNYIKESDTKIFAPSHASDIVYPPIIPERLQSQKSCAVSRIRPRSFFSCFANVREEYGSGLTSLHLKNANGEEIKKPFLLSLNRFDPQKNLSLAIETLRHLHGMKESYGNMSLVLAGGYDVRLRHHRNCLSELIQLASTLDLPDRVHFLTSVSESQKLELLQHCSVFLYTPVSEHFGIAPLEAMTVGKPVVAVDNGGPKESIGQSGECGILTSPDPEAFAFAVSGLLEDPHRTRVMTHHAAMRAKTQFSLHSFYVRFEHAICFLLKKGL